jgi:predicted regulator of Ras-like GTPase activity (Roadblock/LC7/MglB family)
MTMFGFVKKLLRRPPDAPAENYDAVAPEPPPAPVRTPAADRPRFAKPPARQNLAQAAAPHQNGKGIEISLQKILNGLPLELQPRLLQSEVGELTLSIPLEKVLAQLSRGSVKISFGELRQAMPEIFTAENDRDRVLVPLPLDDILTNLNPALIARRRAQRQVEVPPEISSPFDPETQGLVSEMPEPEPAPAPPPRAATPARPRAPTPPPRAPAPASPPPSVQLGRQNLPFTPKPQPPVAQPPTVHHPAPVPPPARPPAAMPPSAAPVRPTFARPPKPAPPVEPPAPDPVPFPTFSTSNQVNRGAQAFLDSESDEVPFAIPAPEAAAPEPEPVADGDPLILSLTSLAEAWPENVRKEIVDLNLVEAKVALPGRALEQGLKQGRLAFTWKTLRSWVKPPVKPSISPADGTVLELPLKVVAPLFLTRQQSRAQTRQKISVDEDIPNLFFGFPQAEPADGPSVAAATARPADTNYYVWDDTSDVAKVHESEVKRGPSPGTKFVAKYASPNEVVSRAAALDGVAGALIALPDGLMVANRLAPDLNGDTLAAFLPQIFGKVSQCTKELRMGELNNLNFTVGNVPWKIFRVNAIFFAAFGRPGEPLPTAQLAALAAELDHTPK